MPNRRHAGLATIGKMIRLCSLSELPPEDDVREFTVPSGRKICVANIHGRYYAVDNVCPHRGAALGQGAVVMGKVFCPWHGYLFDPVTGVSDQDATCVVERYKIEIRGDDVLVDM